ncbi:unnamed protein product, partial [Medioppia subpectinata]
STESDHSVIIVLSKTNRKLTLSLNKINEVELVFPTEELALKWSVWLEEAGVKPSSGDNQTAISNGDNESVSNLSLKRNSQSDLSIGAGDEDMAFPEHMSTQVDEVKRLVNAYIVIMKKTFKDRLPKLCQYELIDSTCKYIGTKLQVQIRKQFPSIDDIIGDDPNKAIRIELQNLKQQYIEGIEIMDKFSKLKSSLESTESTE